MGFHSPKAILASLLAGLIGVTLLTGCDKDDDSSSVTLQSGSVMELYPVVNQSKTLRFEAKSSWTATCNADWVSVSPRKGSAGSNTITITTAATNRTKSNRSTSLTISSGGSSRKVTLVQSGKYAIFNQKEYAFGAEGGDLTLTFKTNLTADDDLQIMYSRQDWAHWADESRRTITRAEQEASTSKIVITPNKSGDTRIAYFVLVMPSDDGEWMGLDTAYVTQAGVVDDYESTDYSADGNVDVLQQSTLGKGIPIVLMGDGFTDLDVADSTYYNIMKTAMEHLFSEEPIRSLRDYFDVYAVTAVSKHSGVGTNRSTVFSTIPSNISSEIDYDAMKVSWYTNMVKKIDIERALSVVIVNSHSHNGVTALLFNQETKQPRQYSVALCALMDSITSEEVRLVLVHEAIGHGFAKLADEYGYEAKGAPTSKETSDIKYLQRLNWMLNIDTTDDPSRVLWGSFIGDSRFEAENIGVYQGAYTYALGVYRPTENSMMRNNDSPFNAPSRKVIYDRVMSLGEGSPVSSFEVFAEFDEQHKPVQWKYEMTRGLKAPWQRWHPAPPRIIYQSINNL